MERRPDAVDTGYSVVMRTLWLIGLAACGAGTKDSGSPPHPCAGVEGQPATIAELVDHINALPQPVDAACLVHSLARPLPIAGSTNTISAQPAGGPLHPRILIRQDALTITVVGAGDGAEVVEFGGPAAEGLSHKGELALPIRSPVQDSAPHDKIEHPEYGTTCVVCHPQQQPAEGLGVDSLALRPHRDDLLEHSALVDILRSCTHDCALSEALLSGELTEARFPDSWRTVYELNE